MEKFEITFNEWLSLNKRLYNDCLEYLNKVLDKAPNNTINISEDYSCCCSYDGGNHPEYASNCFSNISYVFKEDGKIYINCEDCIEYPIESINSDEISNIAFSVQATIAED